jgi:PPP family 3-phenylpropionic acid transporter
MNGLTLRRNVGYAGLSGAYWMLYCVAMSYASVFLLSRGYTTAQIGGIVAAGHVVGLVFQPLAAALADRTPKAPVTVICLCAVCAGVCLALVWRLPGKSTALTAVFVLLLAFVMTLQPLTNAFSFYLERLGTSIYFGLCRGVGSLAYAILSAVLGALTVGMGTDVVPITGLLILAFLLILMALLRREGTPPAVNWHAVELEEKPAGGRNFARRHRSFLFLLAATVFLFFGHAAIMNFAMQVVDNVGGTSEDMGRLCSYVALVEMPTMLLFDRLHQRFSCTALLKFSAVFFLVKSTGAFLATSMTGLYVALFFQALSYPLFTTASVRYAGEHMNAADQNKAQAYITAMITLGNICGSAVGGLVYDSLGIHLGLGAAALCTAVGTVLMGLGMERETSRTGPYGRRI